MLFDTINFLMYKKDKGLSESELLEFFSPYMSNRYLSFYSVDMAFFINETLNIYPDLFDDNFDNFKFFYNVIPKLKYKKVNYLKAAKKTEEKVITEPIIPEFYSKREMEQLGLIDM